MENIISLIKAYFEQITAIEKTYLCIQFVAFIVVVLLLANKHFSRDKVKIMTGIYFALVNYVSFCIDFISRRFIDSITGLVLFFISIAWTIFLAEKYLDKQFKIIK